VNAVSRLWARWSAAESGTAQPGLRPEALPAGTRLGNVHIERALARGASAVLYLGADLVTQAPLAVKVLCPATGDDDAARARFLREAEHASRLDHPNIVRIVGGGQASGIAFMAMEFLPGSDLTRWTRPEHRLPEAAVLEIAAQLADALDHAHRQGVVHRDVKPANAIYDPATRRAVLTDFGISRGPDAQATRSGMLVGSPAYMAPELLAGAAPDARSDLYALGVLCFELLAGRPLFEATSLGALLRAVAAEEPPRLASLQPPIEQAEALDELLAPLLAKSASARAADARAWAARARIQIHWLTAPPAN
jgi:serine/threonine protein kinase